MPELVYLSLGSNLGDREANLAGAITALGTYPEIYDVRSASIYETEPRYNQNQPPFLNTVVELKTSYSPFELLDVVQRVEAMFGRPKQREKNAPRTIDIDILCFGDAQIETETLTIPHPGLPNRRFVLVPFYEIAPDYVVKKWNLTVRDLLLLCRDTAEVQKHYPEKSA
jgi:2-amino-4-hydroxy-6-hydroxymethyldihydropteridine diphosphokinase